MPGDIPLTTYAARTRRAPALLYLDFDGVLHSEWVYQSAKRGIFIDPAKAPGRTLFEWAPILEAELSAAPDVKLVLSTSWARHPGYGRALKWLPPFLRERVIGATYHRRVHGADPWLAESFRQTARGMQVWADVQRRQPLAWAALDDDIVDWPAGCRDCLIACNGDLGLSEDSVRALLAAHLVRLQAATQALHDSAFNATAGTG